MYCAFGSIRFVTENERREVVSEEIDCVFHVAAETEVDLYTKMAEEAIKVHRRSDAVLIRGEIQDYPVLVYPTIQWHAVVECTRSVVPLEALESVHKTSLWKDHIRTGAANALDEAIQDIVDEIDEKNEILRGLMRKRPEINDETYE